VATDPATATAVPPAIARFGRYGPRGRVRQAALRPVAA
jgi:hypothetical protein